MQHAVHPIRFVSWFFAWLVIFLSILKGFKVKFCLRTSIHRRTSREEDAQETVIRRYSASFGRLDPLLREKCPHVECQSQSIREDFVVNSQLALICWCGIDKPSSRQGKERMSDTFGRRRPCSLAPETLESRHLLATDLLASFAPNAPLSSRPTELLPVGDRVFFQADFGASGGVQLWSTDGTSEGTKPVGVSQGGLIQDYAAVNGRLIFQASDRSVVSTDGGEPTVLLRSSVDGSPTQFVAFGDDVVFIATTEDSETVLFRSDGTAEGTRVIEELGATRHVLEHELLGSSGGFVYLRVFVQGTRGHQILRTDGSSSGLEVVSEDHGFHNIGPVIEFNGGLVFGADVPVDSRPDSAADDLAGDVDGDGLVGFSDFLLLSSNFGNTGEGLPGDLDENGTVDFGDFLILAHFFGASELAQITVDPVATERELWTIKDDGSVAQLTDVRGPSPLNMSSRPNEFLVANDTLYFAAADVRGRELWKTNGTRDTTQVVADLVPGADGSDPIGLTWHNDTLFFSAAGSLWAHDPSTQATDVIRAFDAGRLSLGPSWLTSFGDTLVFTADDGEGDEVWISDGTAEGTQLLKDTIPGGRSGEPRWYTVLNEQLIFTARSDDAGVELWSSDGTSGGTQLLRDIRPETQPTFFVPRDVTEFDGAIFFAMHDSEHGAELWTSDGTAEGTELFLDIRPSVGGSGPRDFFVFQDHLYFSADDGVHGLELWRTNGTRAGTELVNDIWTGGDGSVPADYQIFGDSLYFTARNDQHGRTLWRTTGDETLPVFVPPPGVRDIHDIVVNDRGLYFVATDSSVPTESIWFLEGDGGEPVLAEAIHADFPAERQLGLLVAVGDELLVGRHIDGDFRSFILTDGTESGARSVPLERGRREESIVAFDGSVFAAVGRDRDSLRRIDSLGESDTLADGVYSFVEAVDKLFVAFDDGQLGVLDAGADAVAAIVDLEGSITKLVSQDTGVLLETRTEAGAVAVWLSDGTADGTNKLFESDDFSSLDEIAVTTDGLYVIGVHRELGRRICLVPFPADPRA